MNLFDETSVTEITIAPDGRIFAFGTSDRVLEILGELAPADVLLQQRIAGLKHLQAVAGTEPRPVTDSTETSA